MEFDGQNQFLNNSFKSLCFDRSEFNRAGFDVDAFLAKARRRGASLEQIRDDARLYLKIIQNSMIELINKDYADFVHLSSNLAGLRSAIDKLGVAADEVAAEFEQTAGKINSAVGELTKETAEKRRLISEQQALESRIIALSTLERLKKFLLSPYFHADDDDDIVLQHDESNRSRTEKDFECIRRAAYMLEELQSIRNSCSTNGRSAEINPNFESSLASVLDCFQDWLEAKLNVAVQTSDRSLLIHVLRGFAACKRLDAARAIFLAQFIDPDLQQCFADSKKQKVEKLDLFKNVLDQIQRIRGHFWPLFVKDAADGNNDRVVVVDISNELDETAWNVSRTFLDDCLLTALLSHLQDQFSSILIPTDAATFRKAYRFLVMFAEEWSSKSFGGSSKLLKMVFDKFSLPIYYQLCYHEITSAVDAMMLPSVAAERLTNADDNKKNQFSLKLTSFVYSKLISIWTPVDGGDERLFLPPLLPNFLELTLMVINRYGRWLLDAVDKIKRKPGEETELMENGEKPVIPKRASSAALSAITATSATSLIFYYIDLQNLERHTRGDLLPKIVDECRVAAAEDDGITGPGQSLEQCLADTFVHIIGDVSGAITDALIPWLSGQVSGHLASVTEVPRQYRWTRKEAPTQPSAYLSAAFDPIRQVLELSERELPNDGESRFIPTVLNRVLANVLDSYTANLKTVVESVEKISSSLSRLKTKGGGGGSDGARTAGGNTGGDAGAVTDEQKIRMQLRLDVEEFERIVMSFQLPGVCDLRQMKALMMAAQES